MRMPVAEQIDGNARREIEVSLSILPEQIDSLTSHRPHW
jgi:hypothetical protein